jgi:hypothetical protein
MSEVILSAATRSEVGNITCLPYTKGSNMSAVKHLWYVNENVSSLSVIRKRGV